MSHHAPTIKVEVGFQTTPAFGAPFQLDNDPYGRLDTGGGLGGVQFVDVTPKVMSIGITRGRNRNTEAFNAGTASVAFKDPERELDPLNTASIYYPYVLPRQPIRIFANEIQIYAGVITDWNLDYGYTVDADVITATCSDAFTFLANMTLAAFTPSLENTGERINTVLNRSEIEYQGPYDIDFGQSELGAFAVPQGTNVLNYLQNITASEAGWLFVNARGVLTFLDRQTTINPVPTIEFADDGAGVKYQTLTNQFGDELLYNSVQMQSPAGSVQTASDSMSIGLYQAVQYSKLDLLNSSTEEVQELANAFLRLHKDPQLRFTGVTIQLWALSDAHQAQVLSAELADTVDVERTFSTGTPSTVSQRVVVAGISHQITPASHVVTFAFEKIRQQAYLTLADSPSSTNPLSRLDLNALAF